PNTPLPMTPLRQALIIVFKEAFPLARDRLKEQDPKTQFHPQYLDATSVKLDGAYLEEADLERVWMPGAFLRKANLIGAYIRGADLREARLSASFLMDANLYEANFTDAILT